MLWEILLASLIFLDKASSSCISTLYSADTACAFLTDTVVSCSFISSNQDAICTNILTGWEIINGPSCSIKGQLYGCMYSSTTDSTTQILCCTDQVISTITPSTSVSARTTRTI